MLDGWLLVNKPQGITSSDLVVKVRRKLQQIIKQESCLSLSNLNINDSNPTQNFNKKKGLKVGHAGTLDPMASGLMLLAIGKATRLIEFALCADKKYTFTITWGTSTDTYDAEGVIIAQSSGRPAKQDIESALSKMIGEIQQIPPSYSAIKIKGKRAYDLARRGIEVNLSSRSVHLYDAKVLDFTCDSTTIVIHCSKGFYVRSLVRDLACTLGFDGHTSYLFRQEINKFSIAKAIPIYYIEEMEDIGSVTNCLLPIEAVLDDITVLHLDKDQANAISKGQCIYVKDNCIFNTSKIAVFHNNYLLAICNYLDQFIRPIKVFT